MGTFLVLILHLLSGILLCLAQHLSPSESPLNLLCSLLENFEISYHSSKSCSVLLCLQSLPTPSLSLGTIAYHPYFLFLPLKIRFVFLAVHPHTATEESPFSYRIHHPSTIFILVQISLFSKGPIIFLNIFFSIYFNSYISPTFMEYMHTIELDYSIVVAES